MQFLWSGLLVLLAIPPLLVIAYIWILRRRRPAAVRYSSLSLIREAAPGSSGLRRHLPFALFLAAIGALVLALARPVAIVAVPTNQRTIVLTIDVSGSMCSSDIDPTRLQAAENAASAFVDSQIAGTQIGIVAFSGFAEEIQAPTTDKDSLHAALASLATGRRTAIGSGILTAIDAIAQIDPNVARSITDQNPGVAPPPVAKGAYAPDIVVLLTDGVSNTGPDPIEAAQQAADRGVRVYTIGFGTPDGGPLDRDCAVQFLGREPGGGFGGFRGGGGGFRLGIDDLALKEIAQLTGATYHPAESAAELQSVFQSLPTNLITKHEVSELGVGFVGIGAIFAALGLLLGRAWRPFP